MAPMLQWLRDMISPVEGDTYGNILPLARGQAYDRLSTTLDQQGRAIHNSTPQAGELRLALPTAVSGAMTNAIDFFNLPGQALQGNVDPMSQETMDTIVGGLIDTSGIGMAFNRGGPTTLGTFAGRNARNADLDAMERATQMLDNGVDRDTVWRETGWMRGVDGKMRFEIDDSSAALDNIDTVNELMDIAKAEGRDFNHLDDTVPLAGVLDHPELYDNYPNVEDVTTVFMPNENMARIAGNNAFGAYSEPLDVLTLRKSGAKLSDALHEGQHVIQGREGFARGSNPDWQNTQAAQSAVDMVNARLTPLMDAKAQARADMDFQLMDEIDAQMQPLIEERTKYEQLADPYEMYRRQAGEVEARNVEARRNLTAEERRNQAPWETQDYPDSQQIVSLQSGTAASDGRTYDNLGDLSSDLLDELVARFDNNPAVDIEPGYSNQSSSSYANTSFGTIEDGEFMDSFGGRKVRFSDHQDRYDSDETFRFDKYTTDNYDDFGDYVSTRISDDDFNKMVNDAENSIRNEFRAQAIEELSPQEYSDIKKYFTMSGFSPLGAVAANIMPYTGQQPQSALASYLEGIRNGQK